MTRKAILNDDPVAVENVTKVRGKEALLKAGALQNAIFNSANFSSIATNAKGVLPKTEARVEQRFSRVLLRLHRFPRGVLSDVHDRFRKGADGRFSCRWLQRLSPLVWEDLAHLS